MELKVIVVTHKNYRMPKDKCYVPIGVGGYKNPHYLADDTGENIACKNPNYCELTALYWAWKNLSCDYLGLTHYRRHFTVKSKLYQRKFGKFASVATSDEIKTFLKKTDIILPKKRHYFIETISSHYVHTHYPEPFYEAEKLIHSEYPHLLKSWNRVMKRRSAHMFNMFIMKKDKADEYCSFLFEFLQKLENRVDISDYDAFQARVYGRISELLLDVWLDYNNYSYKEMGFLYMEPTNWFQKIVKFLKSKFLHQFYS
jgi:hypothetical protein